MRSRFTMTSSYESYFRARADEPSVGIPHGLKHMLRISLQARDVNRGQSLFRANHEQLGSSAWYVGKPVGSLAQINFDGYGVNRDLTALVGPSNVRHSDGCRAPRKELFRQASLLS